eukprot:COSAG06_NODE_978_length_11240_cov_3.328606_6_plen_90_part_00
MVVVVVRSSAHSECIELVEYGKPPANKKERFKVLQTMFAHAQYVQTLPCHVCSAAAHERTTRSLPAHSNLRSLTPFSLLRATEKEHLVV